MPKPVRKTKPAPKPPRYGAVLLRVAVALEAQGEAIARIEALLLDHAELLQSLGELLRQLIAAPRQGAQERMP